MEGRGLLLGGEIRGPEEMGIAHRLLGAKKRFLVC